MALLDDVKVTLRIVHNKLDADITAKIAASREEMKRLGIDEAMAASTTDELIIEAIKTYCQYKYTDDDKAKQNYYDSWISQVDALRKSAGYMED